MRTSYLTPGLLVLFLVAAVAWFVWRPSPETPAEPAAGVASSGGSAHPAPRGSTPFLASHEPSTAFTPDGDNLAPGYHVEVEALKRDLEAAPQDTTVLLRMARLLQDGHQTEEAVAYYRRYLALHPEGRQAWLDLAQCYGVLERWDDALTATQQMLDRFADDPAALYNLGAIYANTGRPDEARAAWQRVVEQDRNAEMKTLAEGALQRLSAMHP